VLFDTSKKHYVLLHPTAVKNFASKSEFLLSWPSFSKPEANIGPHSMHTVTNISRGSYVLASQLVSIIRDLNLPSKLAHAWIFTSHL